MAVSRLDSDVEAFILSNINSVEQLEILLLLKSKGELDADEITQELRTTLSSVEKRLSDLCRKNFIRPLEQTRKKTYVYDPSEANREIIEKLAQLYSTYRVAIINLIFSQASDVLRNFSDAFRLREKKNDG